MVRRGLAPSRTQAQRLVAEGRVTVGGAPALKAATQVSRADAVHVAAAGPEWASRGAYKLQGALEQLRVDVAGRYCLDAGASTGGFTDVLLRAGAARVIAVDVGYGQLLWRLRSDERVVVLDRTNARHLSPDDVPAPPPGLVVADLSFISLTHVLAPLHRVADRAADYVLLVKPQFEAGREEVGRGGVVREARVWRSALERVAAAGADLGLAVIGACVSPLPGPAGNVEFFCHLRAGAARDHAALLDGAVRQGERLAAG